MGIKLAITKVAINQFHVEEHASAGVRFRADHPRCENHRPSICRQKATRQRFCTLTARKAFPTERTERI
jgi:hypothetical protein